MYTLVEKWLDEILEQSIPEDVIALNFNLYEDTANSWSVELTGCERFDPKDDDWACYEVFDFGTRERPLVWTEDKPWDEILDKMIRIIKKYLEQGSHADLLKKYKGVGIGFVSGNVYILYAR